MRKAVRLIVHVTERAFYPAHQHVWQPHEWWWQCNCGAESLLVANTDADTEPGE